MTARWLRYAACLLSLSAPICFFELVPNRPAGDQTTAEHTPWTEQGGGNDPLPEGAVRRFGSARVWAGEVAAVAFSPDGKTLVSAGDDQTIRYWNLASGRLVRRVKMPGIIRGLGFSPDGRRLVAVGGIKPEYDVDRSNQAQFEAMIDGVLYWRVAIDHAGSPMPLAFSADSKKVLVGNALKLWNLDTFEAEAIPLPRDAWSGGSISCLSLAPDGKSLALTCYGGGTFVIDIASGTAKKIPVELPNCPFVAFAPDGRALATAGGANLRLWDLGTGKYEEPFGGVNAASVVFSPKGDLVAWIDYHATEIELGNPWTGMMARALSGHRSAVRCLAFSPDGKLLASASRDGTVLLWHVANRPFLEPRAIREERYVAREQREPVPVGARTSVVPDKKEYLLGEDIVAKFSVENAGRGVFHISLGGDYRFASRHLRFQVTASDAQGNKVADPDPSGYCMGGLMSSLSFYRERNTSRRSLCSGIAVLSVPASIS